MHAFQQLLENSREWPQNSDHFVIIWATLLLNASLHLQRLGIQRER